MDSIKCPHCGKQVELSEAIVHQLSQAQVDKARTEERTRVEKEQKEKALREKEEKDKELREMQAKLAKKDKEIEEREEKIKENARKEADDKHHLDRLAWEKTKLNLVKSLEEAQRKANRGSQQTQGDVAEIELEDQLKSAFPNDKVSPVVTGKVGGDIVQEVWDSKGNYNGKILWERKNTQPPWKEDWIKKLNSDKRSINAEDAVLISEVLPKTAKNSVAFQDGVWVAKRSFAIVIAMGIRFKIINDYYVRKSSEGKNEKVERLYKYLSGTEFKHRMEAIIESYAGMQSNIEKERNFFMKKWAREEKNLRQLIDNTYGMRGDLEGVGADMLDIEEPLALDSGDENIEQTLF